MIRALALKSWTEPNDSRSEVPNWTKWFALSLWSPELNQMIRALCSEVPNWTKWFALCALKSRTESNDWHSDVPNFCALKSRTESNDWHSEVPNWIKWFALCALKSRTEPNDSRSALWSPELNQMIRALCSEVPNWIKWLALWRPELLRSEVPNWTKWFAFCALKSVIKVWLLVLMIGYVEYY